MRRATDRSGGSPQFSSASGWRWPDEPQHTSRPLGRSISLRLVRATCRIRRRAPSRHSERTTSPCVNGIATAPSREACHLRRHLVGLPVEAPDTTGLSTRNRRRLLFGPNVFQAVFMISEE